MTDEIAGEAKAPSADEIAVSEILCEVGELIELALTEAAGQRYGFALFVFPFHRAGNGSFITNGEHVAVAKSVRKCLNRIDAGKPTPALHTLKGQN